MDSITGEIKKRDDCMLRIGPVELAGQQFVELRQYYKDKNGEFQPSRKVITFKTGLLEDVIMTLEAVKRDSLRKG